MELTFVGVRVLAKTDTLTWVLSPKRAGRAGLPERHEFDLADSSIELVLPDRLSEPGWIVAPAGSPRDRADAAGVLYFKPGSLNKKSVATLRSWATQAHERGHDVIVTSPANDASRIMGDVAAPDQPSVEEADVRAPEVAAPPPSRKTFWARIPTSVLTIGIMAVLFLGASQLFGFFYAGTIDTASGFPASVDGHRSDEDVVARYFQEFDTLANDAPWLDTIDGARVRAASNDVTIYTTLDDQTGQAQAVELCETALAAGADDVHIWGDKVFTERRLDGDTDEERVETEIVESTLGTCRPS